MTEPIDLDALEAAAKGSTSPPWMAIDRSMVLALITELRQTLEQNGRLMMFILLVDDLIDHDHNCPSHEGRPCSAECGLDKAKREIQELAEEQQ